MQGRYLVIKRREIPAQGVLPAGWFCSKSKKSSQEQNLPPTQLGWGHRDEFRKALLRITQMGLLSPWSPGLKEARPARCSPASCPSELRAAALSEAHRRQLSTPRREQEKGDEPRHLDLPETIPVYPWNHPFSSNKCPVIWVTATGRAGA